MERGSRRSPGGTGPGLYHAIIVVWGEWHTEVLLRISLPSLLAEGNLPALAQRADVVLRLYASPAVREAIERSPVFAEVARLIRVSSPSSPSRSETFTSTKLVPRPPGTPWR